jgi:hypothetical protein
MHQQDQGVNITPEQQKKILARVTTHQLIVLENPPASPIEEVRVKNQGDVSPVKTVEPTLTNGS